MPTYSLSEAARLAKVDQSTLYRQVQSGVLSIQVDAKGRKRVDLIELIRVYPDVTNRINPSNTKPDLEKQSPAMQEVARMMEVESLQLQIESLHSQIELLNRLVKSKDQELERATDREQSLERQITWLQERIVNAEVKMFPSEIHSEPRSLEKTSWIKRLLKKS